MERSDSRAPHEAMRRKKQWDVLYCAEGPSTLHRPEPDNISSDCNHNNRRVVQPSPVQVNGQLHTLRIQVLP